MENDLEAENLARIIGLAGDANFNVVVLGMVVRRLVREVEALAPGTRDRVFAPLAPRDSLTADELARINDHLRDLSEEPS